MNAQISPKVSQVFFTNAYLLAKIGADTAENVERNFAKKLATTLPLRSDPMQPPYPPGATVGALAVTNLIDRV